MNQPKQAPEKTHDNGHDGGGGVIEAAKAVPRRLGPVRLAISTLVLLIVIIVWGMLINGAISAQMVISSSMEPTVSRGDRILVVRNSPKRDPVVDDIVMVDMMQPGELPMLKRVVAVPGDYVVIVGNQVFVNRQPTLNDLHRAGVGNARLSLYYRIRDGEYFVIGDNRGNSFDSVHFGPVQRDQIVGHAFIRYSPLKRMGGFDPPPWKRSA